MKKTLLATAIILALAATPTVFAKGKPPPQEETGNNLSFATIFVPSTTGAPTLRIPAVQVPTAPSGPECAQFPGYWCQKTAATWQAEWKTAASASVATAWGANLLGDAPLKAGRPIRVEMGLTEVGGVTGVGYVVTNLTPELDDRLATYGTNATTQTTSFAVWDAGVNLLVEKCADPACVTTTSTIFDDEMLAEINSLGKVVYGFNWGTGGKATAATPGIYRLTFTTNNTSIGSTNGQVCGGQCTYVIIEVTQSAGGGGGGPPNRP
jgi:hypothetical protein